MKNALPPVTFVLGGARSGKSRHAEELIETTGAGLYLATAEAHDDEMAERITRHQARRGELWRTLEAPLALAEALREHATADRPVLVDCLTLWISNLMAAERDVVAEVMALCETLASLDGPVVVVSNEVGLGIVPTNDLARRFRDLAGEANQRVAAVADRVVFMTAGLPMVLKDEKEDNA